MLSPRENALKFFNHEIPERIPRDEDVWYVLPREILERGPAIDKDTYSGGTGYDWFGVHWTFVSGINGATPTPGQEPILTDITKWKDQVRFPDLDAVDWEAAWKRDKEEGYFGPYSEDKFSYTVFVNGPFERLHALMGFEEALIATMLEPEACKEFFEAVVDYKIELLDKMTEFYTLDMINQHDDYAHQSGAFFSQEKWKDLFEAPMRRYVDHCKKKGILYQHHSCGKVESLIPCLIDIGVEHWDPCQRMNNNKKILQEYGSNFTLWGGDLLDYENRNFTEEEMRDILEKEIFSLCKGGAYFPSCTSMDFWDLFCEMLDEKKDFFKDPTNRKLPSEE